jgi:Transglycosylase associated protein
MLDIVLGIVGAIVGGFLFSLFGQQGVNGVNIYSMFSGGWSDHRFADLSFAHGTAYNLVCHQLTCRGAWFPVPSFNHATSGYEPTSICPPASLFRQRALHEGLSLRHQSD